MNLVNGFFIGDDGRAIIEDAAVVGLWLGIPNTAVSSNAGVASGVIKYGNNRVSLDAAGKVVYVDNSTSPYAGKVLFNAGMPFTPNGELLCDSVAPIATFSGGLPFSSNGYLCVKGGGPPPPVETFYILTESGSPISTESGAYLIKEM